MSISMTWVVADRGFGGGPLVIGGIDGRLFGSLQVPLWFAAVLGMGGILLALLNGRRVTSIAPLWLWIPSTLSAFSVFWVLYTTAGEEQSHLGLGVWVALVGLVVGLWSCRDELLWGAVRRPRRGPSWA